MTAIADVLEPVIRDVLLAVMDVAGIAPARALEAVPVVLGAVIYVLLAAEQTVTVYAPQTALGFQTRISLIKDWRFLL